MWKLRWFELSKIIQIIDQKIWGFLGILEKNNCFYKVLSSRNKLQLNVEIYYFRWNCLEDETCFLINANSFFKTSLLNCRDRQSFHGPFLSQVTVPTAKKKQIIVRSSNPSWHKDCFLHQVYFNSTIKTISGLRYNIFESVDEKLKVECIIMENIISRILKVFVR